jgi:hypothetical protein
MAEWRGGKWRVISVAKMVMRSVNETDNGGVA